LKPLLKLRAAAAQGFAHDLDKVMELPHGRQEGQREEALRCECPAATKKLRIVILRFGTARQKMVLE
jgi:hypothetical protein